MNERQQQLFKLITDEYVKTVQPVSSKFITESGDFGLSSATIRNEMAELEKQGYIFHPHTSAGRIPTEKGYQYYVEQFVSEGQLGKKQLQAFDSILASAEQISQQVKSVAKNIAEFSDGAVFVAFSPHDFYYTGLSNLFGQPEFANPELVYNLSQVVDHLDQTIGNIYDEVDEDLEIAIGQSNPFSPVCSSVLGRYGEHGIIGILGPVRMNYQNNVNLVAHGRSFISKLA